MAVRSRGPKETALARTATCKHASLGSMLKTYFDRGYRGGVTDMNSQATLERARSESLWAANAKTPKFPRLTRSTQADVCIVGAGIAGLSCGYGLAQAGKSVVILDAGQVGGGMTQVTTAHLANALDDRYFEIERMHGSVGARRAAESHTAAINRIEAIVQSEKINCDFARLDGYLFLGSGESVEILDRELAAAQRAGLTQVDKLDRARLDFFDFGPCLRFPNQGQVHPLRYLAGLTKAIKRCRGRIYAGSRADEINGGKPAKVKVGDHVVSADAVIVATNTPVNDRFAIHTKQAPYMSYVIAALSPKLCTGTPDPFRKGGRRLTITSGCRKPRAKAPTNCLSSAEKITRPVKRTTRATDITAWKPGPAHVFP
jgi:hypothetical protein